MEEKTFKNEEESTFKNDEVVKEDSNEESEDVSEKETPKVVPLEDYEDVYTALQKTASDLENYKKMALKYKNKSQDEEEDDEDEEEKTEKIANVVIEKIKPLLNTQQEESELNKITKKYEELKRSFENKPQVSGGSSSHEEVKPPKVDNKVTPEIKAILKAKASRIGCTYESLEKLYIENKAKNK